LGCAAYGCRNVDALKQGPDISVGEDALPHAADIPPSFPVQSAWQADAIVEDRMPWEFLFLAASALAALFSMVTCGFPSLAVAASAAVYAAKAQRPAIPILVAVWGVCGLAFIVGLVVSAGLWLD